MSAFRRHHDDPWPNGFSGGPGTATGEPMRLPKLEPMDLGEWEDKDPPARDWFLDNLITVGAVTCLAGHGGSGKTLWAMNLMASAALAGTRLERQFIGRRVRPGISVALLAEDDAHECARRMKRVARAIPAPLSDIAGFVRILPLVGEDATLVTFTPGSPDPIKTVLWQQVEALIEEEIPSLLVLDFAAAIYGGDEIKRDQVAAFMRLLNGLAQKHNLAVLLLVHPSVDGMKNGRGYSGSTAWHNHARGFLYLEADEPGDDERTRLKLTHTKNNYGPSGAVFSLAFDGSTFELIEETKPRRKEKKKPRLTPAQTICLKALERAVDEGGEASPGGPIPTSVRCVRVDLWRRYAYSAGVSDSADEDSRRRAFYDTRKALQAKGLAFVSEPYAWVA